MEGCYVGLLLLRLVPSGLFSQAVIVVFSFHILDEYFVITISPWFKHYIMVSAVIIWTFWPLKPPLYGWRAPREEQGWTSKDKVSLVMFCFSLTWIDSSHVEILLISEWYGFNMFHPGSSWEITVNKGSLWRYLFYQSSNKGILGRCIVDVSIISNIWCL